MSEHLVLPFFVATFDRTKRRGGGALKARENTKEFADVQVFKLAEIQEDFQKHKEILRPFFDPSLIFKVELSQKIGEQAFVQFLERSNIRVLSPSPSGTGYWVLFADDENLSELKRKLGEYGEAEKYKEFRAVESFAPIPPEDKVGEQLKQNPLVDGVETFLDIEIWRMDDKKLDTFLAGFANLIQVRGGMITDTVKTSNLCLLRVRMTKQIVDEIIEFREINRIDRPPKPYLIYNLLSVPYDALTTEKPPSPNATAIAVVDSGILSNHPLLEKAIGDEIAIAMLHGNKISTDKPSDDVGHGTKVAGIALYGNIKHCIENNSFVPEVWILSAKVMYAEMNPATGEIEAKYDEAELLEHQLETAVRWATTSKNCRVINISFGDVYKKMYGNKRQFALATLIDDLANELGVVFVISSGNITQNFLSTHYPNRYPDYLLEDSEEVKIIDPSSSAYAITVGAVSNDYQVVNQNPAQLLFSPAENYFPSPFTCVGPGYKSMVKPELVEEGGNIVLSPTDPARLADIGGKLIVINPNWISDGRLFTVDCGTSLAAPKVAHYLGRLFNAFPTLSSDLVKAILLTSAEVPSKRPGELAQIDFTSTDAELIKLLAVYGYGMPDIDAALSSEGNRVLLLASNTIKLDGVHLYYFYLPEEFISTPGDRQLSVTLVYNPPIRRNRIDYMGVNMEYHIFRNSTIDEIRTGYHSIKITAEQEDIVPISLQNREIKLHPGVRTRKRGIHQKGVKQYSQKPQIDTNIPMVLAIISQNRWIADPDYQQPYSVAVMIKHKATIDLYNQIKQRIELEQRIRVRG